MLVMLRDIAVDAGDVGSVVPCKQHQSCVRVTLKETRPGGYHSAQSEVWHVPDMSVSEVMQKLNDAMTAEQG